MHSGQKITIQVLPKKSPISGIYTQQFNAQWLTDPAFSEWIDKDDNDKDVSYCKCCQIALKNPNRSMLI